MVRGWSYHPQTQGSVANRTFKGRLRAVQASLGRLGFVDRLSEIAIVINVSKSSALTSHITPYKVHFS